MLWKQCLVLFGLGFLTDLVQTIHIQACTERRILLSVVTIIAIYLIAFLDHKWFIENTNSWDRWWITVSFAVGAGMGTGAVIMFGG